MPGPCVPYTCALIVAVALFWFGLSPFLNQKATCKKTEATVDLQTDSLVLRYVPRDVYPGARCLDGSDAGFFIRLAPPGSSCADDWVFFLQGGGLCITPMDCWRRKDSDLGSSCHFLPEFRDKDGLLSTDEKNPFMNCNHVEIPYCSGDTHAGKGNGGKAGPWGLHFAGFVNVQSIMLHLRDTVMFYPTDSSKRAESLGLGGGGDGESGTTLEGIGAGPRRIVLAGGSAGGIGVALISDEIRDSVFRPSSGRFLMPSGGPLREESVLRQQFFGQLQSSEMLAISQSGLFFPEGAHFGWLKGGPKFLSPRSFGHSVMSWAYSGAWSEGTVDWDVVGALRKTSVSTLVAVNIQDTEATVAAMGPGGDWLEYKKATVETARSLVDSGAPVSFFIPPCRSHTGTICVGNNGTTVEGEGGEGVTYTEVVQEFIRGRRVVLVADEPFGLFGNASGTCKGGCSSQ
uniref:Pectin acetylesterase n=1 Tax=Chromera velia CCMP2878 TaxID=1169474 RepID=A0A0G4IC60_9ALVE|eukprot:Cvel_12937.t1-p1 / transcript=Cvel_12937.t1 / gene=Cvel_12937 / organism=Chromera_velia_CCMP2878 / gene_product=hypothetical protein / transcript_product=hypothetical protein / location=Cvel_scaffold865:47200-48570(-) / protein_length=457 / sequence_SO=supercontig / SO=protein_coding / is_pseudo=false